MVLTLQTSVGGWGLTGKPTPAGDIAGLVVDELSALRWQAGQLDFVIENRTLLQFQEGNVISNGDSVRA